MTYQTVTKIVVVTIDKLATRGLYFIFHSHILKNELLEYCYTKFFSVSALLDVLGELIGLQR